MDFSLLQFHSRNFWLRDILALKKRWPYYAIMTIDPILRCNWILYVVLPMDANHSTVFSFAVAFLEVTRRGMWALFRVENEHCANVGQYKASRDVPLPYRIEPLMAHTTSAESSPEMPSNNRREQQQAANGDKKHRNQSSSHSSEPGPASAGPSTADSSKSLNPSSPAAAHVQGQQPSPGVGGSNRRATGGFSTATSTTAVDSAPQSTFRRRPDSVRTFSKMLADAHTQDFEKKRKKVDPDAQDDGEDMGVGTDDDGDDSDEESEDEIVATEASRLRHHGSAIEEEDV